MTKSQKTPPGKTTEVDTGDRWRKILLLGGGFAVLVTLIAVVLVGTLSEPEGGVPEGTEEITLGVPNHVEGEIYDDDEVPAGGSHSPIWANCGFYTETVAAENVLHSLEHGAVWITYRPNISEDQLVTLRRLSQPREKVLGSPVAGQDSAVIATAWGSQLELESADDPRLQQFVVEFAGSVNAPEPGGACTRGVGFPG